MTKELLIDDTTKERTRTLIMDIPAPALLNLLFTSEPYLWHTRYGADVDVMLETDHGPKTVKIIPHDGDVSPKSFDDYFISEDNESDPVPQDKAAATFVFYDDEERVDAAADELLRLAGRKGTHFGAEQ